MSPAQTAGHAEERPAGLRQRAEDAWRLRAVDLDQQATPDQMRQIVFELQVHQIELELQNEELQFAQRELEASRDRYFDLYDLAPVGYLTLDDQGVIQTANLTLAVLLGVDRTSLLKQPLAHFVSREDQDILYHHRRRLAESGGPHACELRMGRHGGGPFWAYIESILKPGVETGSPSYWTTVNDISVRKHAEEALAASEEKYHIVGDSAYDWEAWRAPDGTYRYVSPSCLRISGHTAAEFLANAQLVLDITHPDDLPIVVEHWYTADGEAQEQCFEYDFRILTPGGETRWITHSCAPVYGKDGQWLGRREHNHDSTERRQMQLELLRLAAIVESSNDAIICVDIGGTIVSWNQGAEKLYGYSAAEAIGHLLPSLIAPTQAPDFRHVLATILRGEPIQRPETARTTKDGRTIDVALTLSLVKSTTGQIIGVSSIERDITERNHAEEVLRASEAALKRSQAIAHIGHWMWDIWTNRVTWSDEIKRIFGVDPETIGADLDDLIRRTVHPDDVARVFARNAVTIEEGRLSEMEYRIVRPDGSIRHVWSAQGDRVTDAQGKLMRLYGTVQDVTDRNQAGEQLRVQSSALNAAANAIVITAVDGIIEWVNPAFTALTGYSAAECLGQGLRTLTRSGVQGADFYRDLWQTILGGHVWRGALVNRRKDGTHYVEEQTVTPVQNGHGAITHFISIKQDITARKVDEAERERLLVQVQSQAEQMAQIMRSVPEGVLLLDVQACVVLANPQAVRLLDLLAGVQMGGTLTHLGGQPLDALLTSPIGGQWHLVQAANRSFEVVARPLESGPTPSGWVLVMRDVTQELAVQQQLQRQERLAAVGQLAAGIAHDFNNIMSVIVMYAQITMRAPGLTERERARLTVIDQQAMRASLMIRQILDFSRRSVLDRQPLDLLPLLKEQIKLLERTLPENIVLELVHAQEIFVVKADPTRMQQILMNLAVNARDAMPEGGTLRFTLVLIQVESPKNAPLPGMAAGAWVRLTVTDTGTGIPATALDHVFEPFFTTKEPGKGTGLGLAQVHGIVGQHDGHITVESQPGVGTTFTILLPALAVVVAGDTAAYALTDLPRGHGEMILLVEDDSALRTTLAELFGLWGYAVVEAANGTEALACLTAPPVPIDLIVSDVVMPHMGGVGLFQALRRRDLHIPMILLSGHPLGDELESLRNNGLHALLAKPPSAEQLATTIAAALEKPPVGG